MKTRGPKLIAFSISLCLIMNLFMSNVYSTEKKIIFKDKLDKLFTFTEPFASNPNKIPENDLKKIDKLRADLWNFAKDFPESKYADDAQCVILLIQSSGQSLDKMDLSMWTDFVNRYPNKKLEDFTIEYLRDKGGDTPEMYIPYKLLVTYIKGQKALANNNFSKVEKHFSEIAKKINHNNPNSKKVLKWVYPVLLLSYKKLDRRNDFEKVKEKTIILFPEKREKIEAMWSSPDTK